MRKLTLSLACLVIALSVTMKGVANEFLFDGYAYELGGDRLLYSEHHRITLADDGRYLETAVDYLAPDKQLIARKFLDFTQNTLMPEMRFVDFRTNEGLEVTMTPDTAIITRISGLSLDTDFSSSLKEQGTVINTATIEREKDGQVLDAGFDRMAAGSWDRLMSGSTIEFDFLALSRDRFVGFELSKTQSTETSKTLEIAPQSWLIGLLMTPIELQYDSETQRLMRYRGVTNIAAEEDGKVQEDNFVAEIRYEYLSPSAKVDPSLQASRHRAPEGPGSEESAIVPPESSGAMP